MYSAVYIEYWHVTTLKIQQTLPHSIHPTHPLHLKPSCYTKHPPLYPTYAHNHTHTPHTHNYMLYLHHSYNV